MLNHECRHTRACRAHGHVHGVAISRVYMWRLGEHARHSVVTLPATSCNSTETIVVHNPHYCIHYHRFVGLPTGKSRGKVTTAVRLQIHRNVAPRSLGNTRLRVVRCSLYAERFGMELTQTFEVTTPFHTQGISNKTQARTHYLGGRQIAPYKGTRFEGTTTHQVCQRRHLCTSWVCTGPLNAGSSVNDLSLLRPLTLT